MKRKLQVRRKKDQGRATGGSRAVTSFEPIPLPKQEQRGIRVVTITTPIESGGTRTTELVMLGDLLVTRWRHEHLR